VGAIMTRPNLKDKMKQPLLLLDGAMGTQLIERGIELGKCHDYASIDAPDIVLDVHRAYLQAGSDAVITNTFGANKYTLTRHGLADDVASINTAAAQIARQGAGEDKYVLGDIGPCGDFLEPLGMVKPDELTEAFAAQAQALIQGGIDGLIIETMTALDEIVIAIEAAKSVCGDLPVFASMAFDSAGDSFKTMMGTGLEGFVETILPLGIDAIGFNCGTASLQQYVKLATALVSLVRTADADICVFAEPNAGQPELIEETAVYSVSPEDFAAEVKKIHTAGINIIGGCCGTSPQHIAAVAQQLNKVQ